ncbi:MAG: hypothetical protein LBV33_09045 [Lachnospiraceae bacterium]|jgi:ABC-type Fe3+ transport system permease subunit|nr:hypothetical protein [Lachnospiraceae bacterium]
MDNQNFNQQTQQTYYQPQQGSDLEQPVSIGEWVVTLLVMMVPCLNIIMLFVWAFGKDTKKSKANYCKVTLIFMAIGIVLSIILSSVITAALASVFGSSGFYY